VGRGDAPAGVGPVEAARRWLAAVTGRDVRAAWRGVDPDYRLALTQATIFLNDQNPLLVGHDRDQLARALSSADPHHPLWPSVANLLVEEFLVDLAEIDPEEWTAATSRSIAPGYELVLAPSPAEQHATEPPGMRSRGVLMHLRGDRWLAAGLSERPAEPGWPPDLGY
jgi:hypothetical protein